MVLLKRLDDALRTTTVHALILGTAVNNDGAPRRLPAPSVDGQPR
jgi:acyl transferase domain-containing protein